MTECGSRFRVLALLTMSSVPRTDQDGPSWPGDYELRVHIFDHPLILRAKDLFSFLKPYRMKTLNLTSTRRPKTFEAS